MAETHSCMELMRQVSLPSLKGPWSQDQVRFALLIAKTIAIAGYLLMIMRTITNLYPVFCALSTAVVFRDCYEIVAEILRDQHKVEQLMTPGTLTRRHWKDYTKTTWILGSVATRLFDWYQGRIASPNPSPS